MRFLADENFPGPLVRLLRQAGHDVVWARTDCAGWKDPVLLEFAESEERILLTLDKDFWQIAVQRRGRLEKSGVVWLRVHPATPERLAPLMSQVLESERIWVGFVSIVTAGEIQMLAAGRR